MNTIKTTLTVLSVFSYCIAFAQTHSVQIAVYQKPVASNFFQSAGLSQTVYFHLDRNSFYRYYLGPFQSLEEAEQISMDLKDKGFEYAKIAEPKEVNKYCGIKELSELKKAPKLEIPIEELLASVNFDSGQSDLNQDSKAVLSKVAFQLKRYPKLNLELAGHCDSKGNPAFNVVLSKRRIRSCRNYLVRHGIAIHRLKTVAYGESKPIAINKSADGTESKRGMAYNRRVVMTLMEGDEYLVDGNLERFRLPTQLVFNSNNSPEQTIHVQLKK